MFDRKFFSECDSHIKKISEILDTLIDNTTYDRRLRPNHGVEPVNVGITMHVSSVSAVSEVDMVHITLIRYDNQRS